MVENLSASCWLYEEKVECNGVFFFQAEDGIRDLTVTGVQTCALPICTPHISTRTSARATGTGRSATAKHTTRSTGARRRSTCSSLCVRRSTCSSRKASTDRKSTRLNSSHSQISYAVFCLKKTNN